MRVLIGALAALGLGAMPAAAVEIRVNFANAETTFGYINTPFYTLGSLHYQVRGSSTATFLVDIDSPDAKRAKSFALDSIESGGLSNVGFTFGLSGLEVLKEAQITASAKSSARFFVKNVTTEGYAAPLRLLNAPELAADRSLYASFCPAMSCRFVFIYQVTKVDEGGFGFGRAYTAGGKLTFPATAKLAGFDASISYENSQLLSFQGKATPMFYKFLPVVLVKADDGSYSFLPDIPRPPRRPRAEN